MSQALYRKWRPKTFGEIVGQEHVVRTLRNALASGRVHHAYLFAGPRGTGKTTTARLLAKAVNCLAEDPADRPCNACEICEAVNEGRLLDLIEIDAASNTGVDDVRELRERVGFRPNEARYKVYVIDEVHMLSNAAFNALLKTLEEPPDHAIFVLATTEPQKILATILSRCQRFDFRRIPISAITERLEHLAQMEEISVDPEALSLIARQATGSMRDAESLLDQLAAYDQGGITVAEVRAALGTGAEEAVMSLADALASGDAARGLAIINEAVEGGADPRQFARQVVRHLRALLMAHLGSEELPLHIPEELQEAFTAQARRLTPHQFIHAVRLFNQAAVEARSAWQPQLPLELAFVEAALPEEKETEPTPRQAKAKANSAPAPPRAAAQPTPTKNDPAQKESPPVPAPAPPATETETQKEGTTTLAQVESCWEDLLKTIRANNLSLEALLRSGWPVEVHENVVTIGFAHKFHKGKVEEDSSRQTIEEILSRLLGQKIRLRCVRASRESERPSTPRSTSTPSASPERSEVEERPEVEDGLVQEVVEKLGAKVIES